MTDATTTRTWGEIDDLDGANSHYLSAEVSASTVCRPFPASSLESGNEDCTGTGPVWPGEAWMQRHARVRAHPSSVVARNGLGLDLAHPERGR